MLEVVWEYDPAWDCLLADSPKHPKKRKNTNRRRIDTIHCMVVMANMHVKYTHQCDIHDVSLLQAPYCENFQDFRTNWVHCFLSDREAMQNLVQNSSIWSCSRELLLQSWEKQENNSNLVVTENITISVRKIRLNINLVLVQTDNTTQIDIPNIELILPLGTAVANLRKTAK